MDIETLAPPRHDHLAGSAADSVVIVIGLLAAGLAYAFVLYDLARHGSMAQLKRRGLVRATHPVLFAAGLLVVTLSLLSPLDRLAGEQFSAHMVQHILLMMVAPPLLLFGLPSPIARAGVSRPWLRGVVDRLTDPLLVYGLFHLNLYLWHIPQLYELALQNDLVHDAEHALFFYTASLFWWRVIDPTRGWYPLWRWQPARWVYLLASAPPSYVLGALLWGGGQLLYPSYADRPSAWARSPLDDQRLGGMLMWVQGWMFLMVSMLVFFLWYDPDREEG